MGRAAQGPCKGRQTIESVAILVLHCDVKDTV